MAPSTKKAQQRKRRSTLRPHPLRDQIIDVLRAHDEPLSPAKLSAVTGATLGATAYHVRTLVAAGVIELAKEGRVRGAVEHFYGLSRDAGEAPVTDPLTTLLGLAGALTQPALNGGLPTPTVLDGQGRAELDKLLTQLRPKVRKIAAGAAKRTAAS
jgi:DNA-binding transcriptional ArsR family regulator